MERLAARAIRGLGQGVAALVGVTLLALASGILLASQTATGRQTVGTFVERTLQGNVDGRIEVGRVTGGNLLTRAVLESFRIVDARGRPFLELRDVRVEYRPLGLILGDVHLRRMQVGRMEVSLRQDGDGVWNFNRIFTDAPGAGDPGPESSLRLRVSDARVRNGRIEVRTPWDGSVDEETIWRLEEGEEGTERVVEAEDLSGSLPLLRLTDPGRPMRIEASELEGRLLAVRQPLPLRRLDVAATFGDTIMVELPEVRTAASRLSGDGRVWPEDPPRFRFDLEADRLAYDDLRWLPIPVPEQGRATGDLVVRTAADPEIAALDVTDGDFRSGPSRAEGRFTLYLEEMPRLEDVDLELRPLELSLFRSLTGVEAGPDGWVEGTVAGAGPIDLFRTDAALRFRRPADEAGNAPEGPPSRVELTGGVGLVGEPRALRGLEVRLADFEPRWTRLLEVDTRQKGRVDGQAALDRTPAGRVAFTADLRHRIGGERESHVVGEGSLEPGDPPQVDLRLQARPLALAVLDPWFPSLDMRGEIRGDGSLTGTVSDLVAAADLETPRGQLEFDGTFDLAARRKAYDARLTARGIQLRQWMREGPDTRLDVTGRVRGRGTDPDSLEATFDLELLPSRFHGASLDTSLVRFTVGEGRAVVDTFAVRSDVGTLRGQGGFGLGAGRTGSLFLDLETEDLSTWNRWLVPGRIPGADTVGDDLFGAFPAAAAGEGAVGEVEPPDTLAGALAVRGVADGNFASFSFGGTVAGRDLRWGEAAADSVRVSVEATSVRSLDSLVVEGRAREVGWGRNRADSATVRVERIGEERGQFRVEARRAGRGSVGARGEMLWSPDRKEARLDSLALRTPRQTLRLVDRATVAHGDSGLDVRGLELAGSEAGRLRVDGTVPGRGEASLDVGIQSVDLGGLAGLVRSESELRGMLTGSARVRGTADDPTMETVMRVEEAGWGRLSYDSLDVRMDYRDRRLSGRVSLREEGRELVRLEGGVEVDLALREVEDRLAEDPLDLALVADSLPLGLLLLSTESMREVEGHAAGRIGIRGSPEALRLDGELDVLDGAVRVVPLGVGFRGIAGRIAFQGTEARVDSVTLASTRGGTATVRGTVGFSRPTDPAFDLELRARGLRGIDRRRASLAVEGRAHLGGSYRQPELTGDFRLSNGTIRVREFLRQREVVDLTDPELYGLVDTTAVSERRILARAQNPFLQNLRLDASVAIGPDLWLRSPELSVEVAGDLDARMDRARGDLAAVGSVRLVRGSYRFTGARGVISRQLQITSGRIEFVGTPGGNPNLDITAVHRVRRRDGTIRVEARITGTMLSPELNLTSQPPLGESDQVCVLLLNAPCAAPGAGELARSQLLGRVGTELSSVLASEVGVDYLELRGGQQGSGAGNQGPAADEGSLLAQAEVEAGWYLSPEVFLTVTYPVGTRFPAGALDWRFTESWSLELLSELRFEGGLRTGATSNLERERTWGLFLFREWSF